VLTGSIMAANAKAYLLRTEMMCERGQLIKTEWKDETD
jgi:hypothetical protein